MRAGAHSRCPRTSRTWKTATPHAPTVRFKGSYNCSFLFCPFSVNLAAWLRGCVGAWVSYTGSVAVVGWQGGSLAVVGWQCGSMAVVVWQYGSGGVGVLAWLLGCLVAWLLGCLVAWLVCWLVGSVVWLPSWQCSRGRGRGRGRLLCWSWRCWL